MKQQGEWVRILASSRLECDLAAAVLEANGIETISPGGAAELIGAVFEPSELWVRTEEAARAREVLKSARADEP